MEWLEQILKDTGCIWMRGMFLWYNKTSPIHGEYRLFDEDNTELVYKGHNLERALELMLSFGTADQRNTYEGDAQ